MSTEEESTSMEIGEGLPNLLLGSVMAVMVHGLARGSRFWTLRKGGMLQRVNGCAFVVDEAFPMKGVPLIQAM